MLQRCYMDLIIVVFAVGIVSLLLTVPLSLVGNLLAPKLRDWYSTTSQKRLRTRIESLSNQLSESEREWTFTEAEWAQYRITTQAIAVLCVLANCAFASAFLIFLVTDRLLFTRTHMLHSGEMVFLPCLGYTISLLYYRFVSRSQEWHRRMRTDQGREELKQQLAHLTAKLT